MDCIGIRWALPPKGMVQTYLCNPFGVRVDGGGALLKSLRRSNLIFLMYIALQVLQLCSATTMFKRVKAFGKTTIMKWLI
jgi:hypothetical protein